jgi:hypothetical protein
VVSDETGKGDEKPAENNGNQTESQGETIPRANEDNKPKNDRGYSTGASTVEKITALFALMAAIASAASAYYAYVQAGIASKALLATQRPWISGDSFSLGSDLIFDQRGGHVTIAYTLKNVGNTVAIHVESGVQLIPYQFMAAIDDATNQAGIIIKTDLQPNEVCKPQAQQSDKLWNEERQWGSTLFPNNTIPNNESAEMAPEEIAKFTKDKIGFFGLLIACITYRSPFDDHAHQTGYSFFLLNRGEGHALLDPQMGKISKANLKLTPFWNATGFAN